MSAATFQSTCAAFAKSIKIPSVTVSFVEYIANGTYVPFPDNVCEVLLELFRLERKPIAFRIPLVTAHNNLCMAGSLPCCHVRGDKQRLGY